MSAKRETGKKLIALGARVPSVPRLVFVASSGGGKGHQVPQPPPPTTTPPPSK